MVPNKAANDFRDSGLANTILLCEFGLANAAGGISFANSSDGNLSKFTPGGLFAASYFVLFRILFLLKSKVLWINASWITTGLYQSLLVGNGAVMEFPRITMGKLRATIAELIVNHELPKTVPALGRGCPKPACISFRDVLPESFFDRPDHIHAVGVLAFATAILALSIGKAARFNAYWLTTIATRLKNDSRPIKSVMRLEMAVSAEKLKSLWILRHFFERNAAWPAPCARLSSWVFVVKLQCPAAFVVSAALTSTAKLIQQCSLAMNVRSHSFVLSTE
jgi:hypothetical protein